jgi:anti-sigma B factor antagonist
MTDQRPVKGLAVQELASDGHRTLVLRGDLDIASVPVFDAAFERTRLTDPTALTLDLSDLAFIDSSGLAAIILAGKHCEREGCQLALVRGPTGVQRLFELTGLIDVLPFVDAADDVKGARGHAA